MNQKDASSASAASAARGEACPSGEACKASAPCEAERAASEAGAASRPKPDGVKLHFAVTGMSCAACSARVEKVSNAVEGVESAVVNLLKNTMEATLKPGADKDETARRIIDAIVEAGYGASTKDANTGTAPGASASAPQSAESVSEQAALEIRRRLILSLLFLIPLVYVSMGGMMGSRCRGSSPGARTGSSAPFCSFYSPFRRYSSTASSSRGGFARFGCARPTWTP